MVARGVTVDLPLYIFITLRSETKTLSSSGLQYGLILTQFLHDMGYMDSLYEDRRNLIGPICWTTISRSEAQP